ncbi:MAG: CCA tRNA nucleotidyltransferase [Thermoplasmatota archaeon]
MCKGSPVDWKLPSEIRERVLGAVSPSSSEKDRIGRITGDLLERIAEVLGENGLEDVEPVLAGSVAKGTMTANPDIDVFLVFPPDTDHDTLETMGLRIGMEVLEDPREKYTQHPYVTGRFQDTSCDVVPCISIVRGAPVRTAVDRTPYHTRYVNSRINDAQRVEVLLLKSFLKGIGAYGAEDTVQGCSGYLTELLILRFGTLEGVIEYLSKIPIDRPSPGGCEEIDLNPSAGGEAGIVLFDRGGLAEEKPMEPDRYVTMFSTDPLIIVDPVDPRRNVAAPVSSQTLSYMRRASRALTSSPSIDFFHPFAKRPLKQGTDASEPAELQGVLLELDLPAGDPGVVITQLRRSLRKLTEGLRRSGFDEVTARFLLHFPSGSLPDQGYLKARFVHHGDTRSPGILVLVRTIPSVLEDEYIHRGPPVDNPRLGDFKRKWGDGVRIDGKSGRSFVVLRRDEVRALPLVLGEWESISHGSSFVDAVPEALEGDEVTKVLLSVLQNGRDPWESGP